MSKNFYQKTYKCNCLLDPWGSTCEKESSFVLVENASIDTNTIFHNRHGEGWDFWNAREYMSDEEIGALTDLLNNKDLKEKVDSEFYEYFNKP